MGYFVRFEGHRCEQDNCDGSCGEECGLDLQPPKGSHFCAYVSLANIEPKDPLIIHVGSSAYSRPICEECHAQRCWLPQDNELIEYMEDYPKVSTYAHYCLCECHEPPRTDNPDVIWEDDWDDYEDH